MVDPLFAAAGTAALTQGVAFLYKQAGELLTQRRELRARSTGPVGAAPADALPVLVVPDGIFATPRPAPAVVAPQVLEQHAEQLRTARRGVEDYVLGDGGAELTDPGVRQALDDLRAAMEAVYQTDLTFVGERRDASHRSHAQSSAQSGGITVGGSLHAGRDIAQRDINNISYASER